MWTIGAVTALSIAWFLTTNYVKNDKRIVQANRAVLKENLRHFSQLLESTSRISYALASAVAETPEVQELFAKRDREGLKKRVMPLFLSLRKRFGLAQFQFHLPTGKSFLRLHDPERFGDDLSRERRTVLEANRTRTPVAGLEAGSGGLGIRGVVPVLFQGKHVGSVEFGCSLSSDLVSRLKEKYGFDLALLVPRGGGFQVLAGTYEPEPSSREETFLRKVMEEGVDVPRRSRRGGRNVVTLYEPLKDYSGRSVGVVAIPRDVTDSYRELRNDQVMDLAGGGLVLLVLLGMIHFLIGRFVSKPVGKMKQAFLLAGDGDFSQRSDVDTRDELGSLAESFNHFMEKIQESFRTLVENTKTLDSSVEGLNEVAGEMTSGVEETLDRSGTVAAAAEEMSASIKSVAGATRQAASNVAEVTVRVKELEGSFQEIRMGTEKARSITRAAVSSARDASSGVFELGEAARKIGAVTEVITDISEQTALLSMNATIEASRAGESGKGFAVVANEVKALAKQTADATLEIKERVETIQESTSRAAEKINRITSVVEEIDALVSSIAQEVESQTMTTGEIAQNISQASGGLSEVSTNVEEISSVSLEIARDIAEVNKVAGAMAGNSGDVRENSQKLKDLSSRLKGMVESFQV